MAKSPDVADLSDAEAAKLAFFRWAANASKEPWIPRRAEALRLWLAIECWMGQFKKKKESEVIKTEISRCPQCKNTFTLNSSRPGRTPIYCSANCRVEAFRSKEKIIEAHEEKKRSLGVRQDEQSNRTL